MDRPDSLTVASLGAHVRRLERRSKSRPAIRLDGPSHSQSSAVHGGSAQVRSPIHRRCQTRAPPLPWPESGIRPFQRPSVRDGAGITTSKPASVVEKRSQTRAPGRPTRAESPRASGGGSTQVRQDIASIKRSHADAPIPSEKATRLQQPRVSDEEQTQMRPSAAIGIPRSQTRAPLSSTKTPTRPQQLRVSAGGAIQMRPAPILKVTNQPIAPVASMKRAGPQHSRPSGGESAPSRPASGAENSGIGKSNTQQTSTGNEDVPDNLLILGQRLKSTDQTVGSNSPKTALFPKNQGQIEKTARATPIQQKSAKILRGKSLGPVLVGHRVMPAPIQDADEHQPPVGRREAQDRTTSTRRVESERHEVRENQDGGAEETMDWSLVEQEQNQSGPRAPTLGFLQYNSITGLKGVTVQAKNGNAGSQAPGPWSAVPNLLRQPASGLMRSSPQKTTSEACVLSSPPPSPVFFPKEGGHFEGRNGPVEDFRSPDTLQAFAVPKLYPNPVTMSNLPPAINRKTALQPHDTPQGKQPTAAATNMTQTLEFVHVTVSPPATLQPYYTESERMSTPEERHDQDASVMGVEKAKPAPPKLLRKMDLDAPQFINESSNLLQPNPTTCSATLTPPNQRQNKAAGPLGDSVKATATPSEMVTSSIEADPVVFYRDAISTYFKVQPCDPTLDAFFPDAPHSMVDGVTPLPLSLAAFTAKFKFSIESDRDLKTIAIHLAQTAWLGLDYGSSLPNTNGPLMEFWGSLLSASWDMLLGQLGLRGAPDQIEARVILVGHLPGSAREDFKAKLEERLAASFATVERKEMLAAMISSVDGWGRGWWKKVHAILTEGLRGENEKPFLIHVLWTEELLQSTLKLAGVTHRGKRGLEEIWRLVMKEARSTAILGGAMGIILHQGDVLGNLAKNIG